MGKMFEFELKDTVRLIMSEEEGIVVGRAMQRHRDTYNVRFVAADGRQVEAWFPEDALGHRPR